jgi:hypothetical protein
MPADGGAANAASRVEMTNAAMNLLCLTNFMYDSRNIE